MAMLHYFINKGTQADVEFVNRDQRPALLLNLNCKCVPTEYCFIGEVSLIMKWKYPQFMFVSFDRLVGTQRSRVNIQNSSWNQLFQSSPAQLNFTFWNLWENRNSERIFHARKENVNIPCTDCAWTVERIFEFIDQNVKKNTLNSNDVQRERERERVIIDCRSINSAVKKCCQFCRAKNVLTEWTLSCFILWK